MSGLFRRLAANALGQTVPVRSAARLPYSEPSPFAAIAGEPGDRPRALPQRPNSIARQLAPPTPELPPGYRRETVDGDFSPPTVVSEPASRHPAAVQPAAIPAQQPQLGPLVRNHAEIARSPGDLGAPRPPADRADPEIGRASDDDTPDRAEAAPPTTAAHRAASLRAPQPGRPPYPPPLVRPATSEAVRGQRLAPQPAAGWAGRVEEATEVHVSIGRIEVTAVHETVPPRRPAPRAPKPMSLEEYLSRRGGSR